MALDFLLLYEHTVREYESDLLLKLELERRGYSCEIRQLLDRKKLRYFTWKKPRVLVSSNLYDNEGLNSHVYNNIGRCDRVVNLHWEQMLSDTQEEGDWFNMAGNAKKMRADLLGQKNSRTPAGPRHGGQKHPRDRRGDDGFSAPGICGVF